MQLPEPRSNLVPGTAISLGAGVRRIVAPNAGLMTGPGTNTYLLGTREIAVLDPGPHDGEALVLGDIALTAIHTPGHASNCVCYLSASERLLFTGDHVLEGVSPV